MKSIKLVILIFSFTTSFVFATEGVQIIPQPTKIKYGKGHFLLKRNTDIIASNNIKNEAEFLAVVLEKAFNKRPKTLTKGNGIHLKIEKNLKDQLGEEGYILSVRENGVFIEAAESSGIFYGIQSLRQLLPTDFEYGATSKSFNIPVLEITDKPRFPWRSFMLDESRHFNGAKEVKKLLDQMALLKMNTFHWHLTDDQGWRIEIKKYPKLTEIGSKRKDTQTERGGEGRTGEPHEGFYSQEEIKEIIEYAKVRHIKIVPEIEMPGHAMAAVAAYPWLGSLGSTKEVSVIFGKMDDSFNIANPKVVQFLKDVLDEVMALFPGQVIHIGGDEVNFTAWENSEEVRNFMIKKNLSSPVDLQIYFTNQISNYIDNAGKRMMGWNEILGDDIHEKNDDNTPDVKQKLAKSAIVHFWKGDLKLINKAVQDGYDVVNSNHWDTYLDYTYERLPLSKSYAFDPIPEGLDEKFYSHILGTGSQMWSEWTPTVGTIEKQIFPRLAAYAEVGWTETSSKDFERFKNSLKSLKKRWTLEGINFHQASN